MEETVYLNLPMCVTIHHRQVRLGEVGELFCSNSLLKNQLEHISLTHFQGKKGERQVYSLLSIIQRISQEYPQCQVVSLGETDVILCYESKGKRRCLSQGIKVAIVTIITFFGAAFSIMTFNTDVTTPDLFARIHFLVMGYQPSGPGILEFTYSLGMAVGIMVFFNQVGGKPLTPDPTPLQVQMRLYEENADKAYIMQSNRQEEKEHDH